MHVKAMWQGKRHFEAIGPTGRTIHMDASPDIGGSNLGNRPMELVLMGLIGCTGIDVTMILERMREPLEALDIEASGTRSEAYPQAFTAIDMTYRMTGNIDPKKAWRAIYLSEEKYCSVSASLNADITPHLVLNGEVVPSEQISVYEKDPSD